jgi:DNA-binding response OmpR family regulator
MSAVKTEEKFNFGKAKVAVIDASLLGQEVASNILQAFGFRAIFRCGDIAAAATTLLTNKIDLILLDPYSFGAEGYDFVRKLRADSKSANTLAPVIIVTAYTHMRSVTEAQGCGADYIIVKPFSTGSLLERILWVAAKAGHRSELATQQTVSTEGSGMELW